VVYHKVCDAWPMRHQIYGDLSRFGESPPSTSTKLYYLVTEAHVREWLAQGRTWQCSG